MSYSVVTPDLSGTAAGAAEADRIFCLPGSWHGRLGLYPYGEVSNSICARSGTRTVARIGGTIAIPFLFEFDPFKLTAGSSFSASGSADTRRNASASIASTRSSVFEAEEIIRKNYGGGRTPSYETMTGSAISGALASLDPHSRFYGRAAWRELLDEEQSGYVGIGVSISTFEVGDTRETYVISTFAGSPAAKAAQIRGSSGIY